MITFGTGGVRAPIGEGTNRMNVDTVAKISQGVANYLLKYNTSASVVIGYDSRIKSDVFAKTAARVFAANGISVYFWKNITPVPTVSFAVRYFKVSAGIMITASHNPANYNGYKVYGPDGAQITTEPAKLITEEIDKLEDIKIGEFDNNITFIGDDILNIYLESVKKQSVLFGDEIDKNISIVYSPLNGTGYIPITKILTESGYNNITLVEEQKMPNGNFPTCPIPNPELKETMSLGIKYAEQNNADMLIATDPDCDRAGVAIRTNTGEYNLLSGNEVGVLLLDYICSQRVKYNMMPHNPTIVKTIVTTDMAQRIAESYGVETINVYTGFKFIGEKINTLEDNFIFGFEESCGYLSGTYVRDKDAVNAVYLICEMLAYYKARNINLQEKLDELYDKHGYYLNTLHSFKHMVEIGDKLAKRTIDKIIDYAPENNMIKYIMEDGCSVVIRPSGTEPKIKVYISIYGKSKTDAKNIEQLIVKDLVNLY